ncbi:hypothetical protein ACIQF6_28170 [Kitasatospora sp. NPDC092948]|uniref:hypothetical protein n=1 Tax=Kitasatospora sp. NPDC092948 TaxID=3364088 RepID=UPI0037F1F185
MLEQSVPPSWFAEHSQELRWQERFAGQKLHLKAVCERGDYQPWIVLAEVEIPDHGQ